MDKKVRKKYGKLLNDATTLFSQYNEYLISEDAEEKKIRKIVSKAIRKYEKLVSKGEVCCIEELFELYNYIDEIKKPLELINKYSSYIIENNNINSELCLAHLFKRKSNCLFCFDTDNPYEYDEKSIETIINFILSVYKSNDKIVFAKYLCLFLSCFKDKCKQEYIINTYCSEKEKMVRLSSEIALYYLSYNKYDTALEWLQFGSDNQINDCNELLGDYYNNFYDNAVFDLEKSIYYYKKYIENKTSKVNIKLVDLLIKQDAHANKNDIVKCLIDYIDHFGEEGYVRLGKYYLYINDNNSAFRTFLEGANKDNLNSIYECAKCYRDGIGVEQDIEKAINLFSKIYEDDDFDFLMVTNDQELDNTFYSEYASIYYNDKYNRKNNEKLIRILKSGINVNDTASKYMYGRFLKDEQNDIVNGERYIQDALDSGFNLDEFEKNNNNDTCIWQNKYIQYIVAEKDEIIRQQREEIDNLMNMVIKSVQNTHDIVLEMSSKIDYLVDDLSKIKSNESMILDKIDKNSMEYENKINDIQDKLLKTTNNIVVKDDSCKTYLINLFGESNWNKLTQEGQKFLTTSIILFDNLRERRKDDIDFSAVCLMVCKATEIEFKKRFVVDFIKYLDNKYQYDYGFYPSQLLTKNKKNETTIKNNELFTLGDIPYILCASYTKNKIVGDYFKSKKEINEYCEKYIFKEKKNDNYIDNLCNQLNRIKNDYRNPACHIGAISFVTASECVDFVLENAKFLIKFIDLCNY